MTDAVSVFDPGWRLLDASGDPVSGGKIKFFDAGTSTPKNVFSDAALSNSLGSVVYTGSDGAPVASSGSSTKVRVYTGAAAYKIQITDADDVDIFPAQDNCVGAVDTSTFLTSADTTTVVVPVTLTSIDLTLDATHKGKLIRCVTTGGALQITLPDAATVGDNWNVHILLDGDATAGVYNAVKIVTADSGQKIVFPGGVAVALSLTARGEVLGIACDGTNFRCMGYAPIIKPNNTIFTIAERVSGAPSSPSAGARYIVSSAYSTFSTGDVIEADGQGGYIAYTPYADCGWLAYVQDENALYAYVDSAWVQQYAPASDTLAGLIELAVQSEMETATDVVRAVTPGRVQYHPGVAKAWGLLNYDGTIAASHNVTSLTDGGSGIITVTIATDFSSANYAVNTTAVNSGVSSAYASQAHTLAAGSFVLQTYTVGSSPALADATKAMFSAFGDQ